MAVPMTLAEARTNAAQLLDDPNNRRWSTTQIDFALQSSLSRCLQDYQEAGGERFDTEHTGTTSAVDGTLSLATQKPLAIKSFVLEVDDTFIPVRAVLKRDRYRADNEARTIRLIYVRDYELPSTTTHALVGNGATAANTWAAFDHWVVARAALQLAVKDDKLSQALAVLDDDLKKSCLARPNNPVAMAWPRSVAHGAYGYLRWTWLPSTQTLQMCNIGGAFS